MNSETNNDPWLPPGHAERLVVGARVRIRLSGECDHQPALIDGSGGTIIGVGPWYRHHYYSVVPDCVYPSQSWAQLSASELEVID